MLLLLTILMLLCFLGLRNKFDIITLEKTSPNLIINSCLPKTHPLILKMHLPYSKARPFLYGSIPPTRKHFLVYTQYMTSHKLRI